MVMTAMALMSLLMMMSTAAFMVVVMMVAAPAFVALFVMVAASAAMFMVVVMMMVLSMYPIPGMNNYFSLHGPGNLRQLREQSIRVVGGDPQLTGGEGNGGLLHFRVGIEFGFDLGGAVGAVQIFHDVYFLHGDPSLFSF